MRNSTPMTQSDPDFRKALEPAIDIAPMRRIGTAQEIADACLFLCSSKASFVQGHAMVSLFPRCQSPVDLLGCGWWICNQLSASLLVR